MTLERKAPPILSYQPLVRRIAYDLLKRLPCHILFDDLQQAGMLGLLEAARYFDETRGVSFAAYASLRIRGAMIDEIRRGDWAPRSLHRRARQIAEAIHQVEKKLGKEATEHDIAATLDISLATYQQWLHEIASSRFVYLNELGMEDAQAVSDQFVTEHNPMEDAFYVEFNDWLRASVIQLPEREQQILRLYYEEERTLKQIGEQLSLSESRVSQIHSQAMLRLQIRMQGKL